VDALRDAGVAVGVDGRVRVHLVGYGDAEHDLAADATVTVTMDTPYLLAHAASPVLLATYSSGEASMVALAAVLAGHATAPGRCPVPVRF
jgi:beta-N-acetylhexosaminidase